METSTQKFIKWFFEFYDYEFPSLSRDFKHKTIKEVLLNNHKYITKKEVMKFDGCVMCGRCCKNQRCPDYDSETHKCTRHNNPIHELCKTYPWTGEDMGIAPLSLDCEFMVFFFVDFFDKYFQHEVDKDAS